VTFGDAHGSPPRSQGGSWTSRQDWRGRGACCRIHRRRWSCSWVDDDAGHAPAVLRDAEDEVARWLCRGAPTATSATREASAVCGHLGGAFAGVRRAVQNGGWGIGLEEAFIRLCIAGPVGLRPERNEVGLIPVDG
jgi:hypothetical protein